MNIYFTAAIFQMPTHGGYYAKIIETLKKQGHNVVHDHITDYTPDDFGSLVSQTDENKKQYYSKVLKWISKADLVVAELSFPSTLNVGHEVTMALSKGKPVVGLYFKDQESFFFEGIQSDKFVYESYTAETLAETLEQALEYAQEISDTRFNFFISPSLSHYLDWVSQTKKIPRSVYLRQLIEEDREQNKAYFDA